MPDDLIIDDKHTIPGWRLVVETARSGGPGGQHANTADTAVRLRLHLGSVVEVHRAVLSRIRRAYPGYVTNDDELLIHASTSRSQSSNLQDAYQRMGDIFREHLTPPRRRRPPPPPPPPPHPPPQKKGKEEGGG
ncbi:MAG: peptide chain release factor-like protein, partial [Myxococcota bacterium]